MSERKSKSSTIDPPQPNGPIVGWDFNVKAKAREVKTSEPNIMIHAFHGRAWDERGTMNTSKQNVPRRQMMLPKIPKVC
jgi:hypothetical protein